MARAPHILPFLIAIVLVVACGEERPSAARIESLRPVESISGTEAVFAAYGPDIAAVMPGSRLQGAASDAAALSAVRSGEAVAALVRRTPADAGLVFAEIEVRPIGAFVPFTFAVEEVTAAQLRELAAGRVRGWRELGGPAVAVDVAAVDAETVGAVLEVSVAGAAVEDAATALAQKPGRVVFAARTGAGPMQKPLRVDGARPGETAYPFVARWSLAFRAGEERGPALALALAERVAARAGPEVVLDAVGDIMLGRGVGQAIAREGARYPFEAAAPLLAGSDLRVGNLELPLTERGQPAAKDYTFRAPPAVADGLTAAGFDLLTLANNHTLDYGTEGLLDTIAALERAGIAHAGAGRTVEEAHRPATLTVRGLRLALLSYVNTLNDARSGWVAESMRAGAGTPGVAWGSAEAVRRDVTAAREQADLVIVALHCGWEYSAVPNPVQRELAHAAIDAGAALVLGAHPHVLQGIELYKGVPIVYSLGNFVFDLDDDDRRQPGLPSLLSAVLRVRLGREGVRGLELRPAIIDQRVGRPLPVAGAAARPVYERLYALTDALNSR